MAERRADMSLIRRIAELLERTRGGQRQPHGLTPPLYCLVRFRHPLSSTLKSSRHWPDQKTRAFRVVLPWSASAEPGRGQPVSATAAPASSAYPEVHRS